VALSSNAPTTDHEFKMFKDVIARSSRPNTTTIVTEWSSYPDPSGVGCDDVYAPGSPSHGRLSH
jgi:hypothetical protein